MREVAHNVIATVSSGHDVEVLQRKLIAVRTEIDAILSLLAAGKVDLAPQTIEVDPTAEKAPEPFEAAPADTALAASTGASGEVDGLDPRNDCELRQADHEDVLPMHAVAPDGRAAEASAAEIPASAANVPTEAADQPEDVADATLCVGAGTEGVETAASQAEMPIELAAETAAPGTSGAAMEVLPTQPTPAVTIESEHPVEAPPAQAATAEVVSLQPRLAKPSMQQAAAAVPSRPRRRLAAKIAASIIALLAAATVLILADEEIIGSAQSLPWMSPQPAQSGATWPFIVGRQGADLETTAVEESSIDPAHAGGGDTLLLRYREVWPLGW